MHNMKNDNLYISLIKEIIENKQFTKIKDIEHHGTSRYDHSFKVSYYSYKIAKMMKLDYEDVARGGLLHDFFLSKDNRNSKERITSTFSHPKKAVANSVIYFDVNEKEIDIIKSHMFPLVLTIPKYMESWVVSSVDKIVSLSELTKKYRYKIGYAVNFFLIFLFNH